MNVFYRSRWGDKYLHNRWGPKFKTHDGISIDNKKVEYVVLDSLDERYRVPFHKWAGTNVGTYIKKKRYNKGILKSEEINHFVSPVILEKWFSLFSKEHR